MPGLVGGETEGPGQCIQDAVGGMRCVTLLEAHVVPDAQSGEIRDLRATEPWGAARQSLRQPGSCRRFLLGARLAHERVANRPGSELVLQAPLSSSLP